jgi:hypothetical protein
VSLYEALAVREGNAWRVHLPGIAVLGAADKADVEPLVRDVVATVRGVEPETVQVRVRYEERSTAAWGRQPAASPPPSATAKPA